MYSEPEALNLMLMTNSEMPLIEFVDDQLLQVKKTRPILRRQLGEELRRKNNFNMVEITLLPATNGTIDISKFVQVYFQFQFKERLVLRDGIIWDVKTNLAYAQPIKVLAWLDMSFDELPEVFRELVAYEAALEYCSNYGKGAGSAAYARLTEKRNEAWTKANNSEYHFIQNWANLSYVYSWHGVVGTSPL